MPVIEKAANARTFPGELGPRMLVCGLKLDEPCEVGSWHTTFSSTRCRGRLSLSSSTHVRQCRPTIKQTSRSFRLMSDKISGNSPVKSIFFAVPNSGGEVRFYRILRNATLYVGARSERIDFKRLAAILYSRELRLCTSASFYETIVLNASDGLATAKNSPT